MRNNNASQSKAPGSSLEQMTLLKEGGLCVICGPSTRGFSWPNMTQDMLLRQVLKSERFQRAVVICIDRSIEEVQMQVEGRSSSKGSKLMCIPAMGITTGTHSMQDVIQQVRRVIQQDSQDQSPQALYETSTGHEKNEQGEKERDRDEDEQDTPQLSAVFVSSLSALHLAQGGNAAVKFMSELSSILAGEKESGRTKPVPTAAEARSRGGKSRGVVVGVVHSEQHAPRDIVACYRSRADVFSSIIVNEGQLSSTVAIEVASVRVGASMKVTEGIDSLALSGSTSGANSTSSTAAGGNAEEWRPACLVPLPKRQGHDDNFHDTRIGHEGHGREQEQGRRASASASASARHVKDGTMEQVESIFGKGLGFAESTSVDPAAAALAEEEAREARAALIANRALSQQTQRLITFASTDPEFDEDSDPDGDLDL